MMVIKSIFTITICHITLQLTAPHTMRSFHCFLFEVKVWLQSTLGVPSWPFVYVCLGQCLDVSVRVEETRKI